MYACDACCDDCATPERLRQPTLVRDPSCSDPVDMSYGQTHLDDGRHRHPSNSAAYAAAIPRARRSSRTRRGRGGVAVVPSWHEDTANSEDENRPRVTNWLSNMVAAVMVAVRFSTAPANARARQRCRGTSDGDHRGDQARRAPVWKRTKDKVRDVFDKAADKIREVKDKFLELFDDPVARAARLVGLGKLFKVRDMPRQTGHKRHASSDLFKCDQHSLGAAKGIAAGVKQMCFQIAAEFPEIGYNQVRTPNDLAYTMMLLS